MHIRVKIPTKKKVFMCLIALAIVSVVLVFALRKEKKTLQYDIVVLGDSVVGNVGEDGVSFTSYLEEKLNKTVFKGGFGGTTMSLKADLQWGSISSAEWSMVKLAEAISYDDWKSQKATMAYAQSYKGINYQALHYFEETMDGLCQIDFGEVEILIIEHGTNDYNNGKILDNPDDLYDVTTFGGALRRSLKLLKKSYPDLRIVLMSPIYCEFGDAGEQKCYNTKIGNGRYLDEYVALEKEIAQEFEVEWIDAYHGSGIWAENAEQYIPDGLHLNTDGHKKIADFLADYLQVD